MGDPQKKDRQRITTERLHVEDIFEKLTVLSEKTERMAFEVLKHILLLVALVSTFATTFSYLASGLEDSEFNTLSLVPLWAH